MITRAEARIEDLYSVPENGKAEIVEGDLVSMSPTGDAPNAAATEVLVSLHAHARRTRHGRAYSDNAGFKVDLPNRKSFSPDVAFYTGRRTKMEFLDGAPVLAVEVRSAADYGPKAERAIEQRRADYFAAGTLVVWDVDLLSPDVIKSYDATNPDQPTTYRRGDVARAESAVPGWGFPVADLFL